MYSIVKAKNGQCALVLKKDGRETRLNSLYDPLKESERMVSTFNPGRSSLILVTGLALGYHIDILHNKYPHHILIVLEPEKDVIYLCKKERSSVLKKCVIIGNDRDLETFFETFNMSDFRGIALFTYRPSYQLDPDFYSYYSENIKKYLTSKVSDLLTRFEFEEEWIHNIFSNIHHIYKHPSVSSLHNAFKNTPAVIVSAGPSLRKNMKQLRMIQNKALIVAVDTALPVLIRSGIEPHIVMTLDAQKHSIKHFKGWPSPETTLIADMVSYPKILRDYKGNAFLSSTSKFYTDANGKLARETTPSIDWFEKYTTVPGDIQSGGSVATSVFDLFLTLGCDPILLVGQDLAYTGREIHCSGTHHNDAWLPLCNRLKNLDTINQQVIRKRSIKRIPSWGQNDDVISDFVFDLYRQWFEDSAAKVDVAVYNCTEGGGKILNTIEKPLNHFVETLPDLKKDPKEIMASKTHAGAKDYKKLLSAMDKTINFLKSLPSVDMYIDHKNLMKDIDKNGLLELLSPFLRKTEIILTRKEFTPKEALQKVHRDIEIAAQKLIPMLENAVKKLNSL
jgi:hypothetical protein